jgi:type I restriction enzyme S subunit
MKTEWETLPLEKCIENVEVTTKILKKNFLSSGTFPVISQEAELISGYWDKEDDVFMVSKPVVVYGDHTRVVKYVDLIL